MRWGSVGAAPGPDYGVRAMRLTVLIPTRDRHDMVADCLASLNGQVPQPEEWEIIVVDDGSDEPLAPVVERTAEAGLPVRCLTQGKAGLNAARNHGVAMSEGEVIAFLDDDTIVSPGWAAAVEDGFANNECEALGGRVVLQLEGGGELPDWLTERRLTYLSHYDLGGEPREVNEPPLPVGANFALRRSALERLGGFRDGLDRIGNELISNGEYELLRRILADGGEILYWPTAEVLHRVPRERLTKEWFRRRARAQGVSDIRTDPLEAGTFARRYVREGVRAGRALPILARRLVERRGSFDAELWLIACRARLKELRRQRAALA